MSAALRIRLMVLWKENYAGKESGVAGPTSAQRQPRAHRFSDIADVEHPGANIPGSKGEKLQQGLFHWRASFRLPD